MNTHTVLEATANQILALVAPATARLVRVCVSFDEEDDTAATDGVRIWIPPIFDGVDVVHDTPVAVGLLVHELGHFLQPLTEMEQAEQKTAAPHWLSNIILDIQGEAMMAAFMPPLADTLRRVREIVWHVRQNEYRAAALQGRDLAAIAGALALIGRFGQPEWPFGTDCRSALYVVVHQIHDLQLRSRAWDFVAHLSHAQFCPANDLPAFLQQIMNRFPELQCTPVLAVPGGRLIIGKHGQAAQAEALAYTGAYKPESSDTVTEVHVKSGSPRPEAVRMAAGLRVHFQMPRGATEIVAPGRLDRRAAALGELVPLRMALPGRERPRPRVVICLDKSSSMLSRVGKGDNTKFSLAQIAAQAVALAVQEAGGEVVGILFDGEAQVADTGDAALLFHTPADFGNTAFEFLADAWRRWPEHRFLLVTDGDGSVPLALPGDKARTCVILIPPGDRSDLMQSIADQVVVLTGLRNLAGVLTLLTPRPV